MRPGVTGDLHGGAELHRRNLLVLRHRERRGDWRPSIDNHGDRIHQHRLGAALASGDARDMERLRRSDDGVVHGVLNRDVRHGLLLATSVRNAQIHRPVAAHAVQ